MASISVVTFLLVAAIEAGKGTQRTKPIWMMMLLYIEAQILIAWFIPHFKLDEAAMLLYLWDFIQDSKKQFDDAVVMNDGTGEELPDGVNELIA